MVIILVQLALVCIAVFLVDGPSLIRRRRWREFGVYLALYLTTAAFSFYWAVARPRVALNRYLMRALEPVAKMIFGPPGGP